MTPFYQSQNYLEGRSVKSGEQSVYTDIEANMPLWYFEFYKIL